MADNSNESNKRNNNVMSTKEAFRRRNQERFMESYYANGSVFSDVKPFSNVNDSKR